MGFAVVADGYDANILALIFVIVVEVQAARSDFLEGHVENRIGFQVGIGAQILDDAHIGFVMTEVHLQHVENDDNPSGIGNIITKLPPAIVVGDVACHMHIVVVADILGAFVDAA